jgi:hypothetical protein
MTKETTEKLQDLRSFIEEAIGFADDELIGEEKIKVVYYLDEMSMDLQEFIASL